MKEIFVKVGVTRRLAALVTVVLIGCAPHGSTQGVPGTPGAQTSRGTQSRAEPDAAALLDKQVKELFGAGKYQEAIPLAERSLALREQALGPRHLDVATSLSTLASLHQMQGAYEQAESLHLRALHIRKELLGEMDPSVGSTLNDLGNIYSEQGAYARAIPLYLRALEIAEKKSPGAPNSDVGAVLTNLANVYQTQGDYTRAEPLQLRALEIMEKSLGAMHPDVAIALNNLAGLFFAQGAYARAEPLLVRALEIKERALGVMHADVAVTLDTLASLYQAQGAYTKAEPLFRRALEIREKALGAMHPDVANSLNNLAMLHYAQGAYARAELLWTRALDIREKVLGAGHPAVANILNNLAMLYCAQGAYARAEPLYLRALEIKRRALGAMHPDVASVLGSLASLYAAQGAYARAEPLYLRSLDIHEKALGAMHPDVAISLNNLARFYLEQDAYARAEPLLIRALDIWEKAVGAMHPGVAASLTNLGMHFLAQGAYTRAEPLLLRALDIREKSLGTIHPQVAESLNNLAGLWQDQGMYARAVPLLARAAEIRESYLRNELTRLSESRKLDLMSLVQGETERLVSLHADAIPTSSKALELAFTAVLRRKGRVLDSLADAQAILREHLTPQLNAKLDELDEARSQLSMRLRARFELGTAEDQKAEIASLRDRIDKLEGELNRASVDFRVQAEPVTLAKIQAALPRGAALIELVRYRRFDARRSRAQGQWQEARYLAYILPWQGPAQWVPLGDAARIDAGVDAVLAAMRKDAGAAEAKAALRNLDTRVYAPIRSRLAGIAHVILSPDGKLNLVPFEALIDPQGRYALEQHLISYVTSGRDLLRLAARQAPRSPAMIVADPDYGPQGKPYVRVDGTVAEIYGRLAGTVAEASGIQGYFSEVKALTRGQATKAALTAAVGPSVLHVATHGFYARAAPSSPAPARPSAPERGMSIQGAAATPSRLSSAELIQSLDRTGLALAGANVGPEGIVSARELASRDWWGTQLVVLSACGTGVGAVPSGEGVYGMRRALVLAGARSQVVSLWNVNDSSAPVLMREMYAELARGTGRAEALRRAKLRTLRQPQLAAPYYWAAFISAGDWTPLDKGIMRPGGAGQVGPASSDVVAR